MKKTTTPTTKTTKNVKNKSDSTKANSFALPDANKPTKDKKVVGASNGNDIGNDNEINVPERDVPKPEIVTNIETANAPDNRDPIEKFLADFNVESKIKLMDDIPAAKQETTATNENEKPANGISMIPNNLVRRNVSTDGIIK